MSEQMTPPNLSAEEIAEWKRQANNGELSITQQLHLLAMASRLLDAHRIHADVSRAVDACLSKLEDRSMHNAGKGQAVAELADFLRLHTAHTCRECGKLFTWVGYDETRCFGCQEGPGATSKPEGGG